MQYNKLLDQFRSFYFRNYPDDMESQIEYFSVFGGLGWEIDTSKPLEQLITTIILENFNILHEKIEKLTLGDRYNKRLLHALAIGDRRIFSAFKRAGLNNSNGGMALNYLNEKGIVQIEFSREEPAKSLKANSKLKREVARHRISHKVLFTHPFIRFWFYFVNPHVKEIKENNFENVIKDFKIKKYSYASLIFEEISEILLNYNLRDSHILSSSSYWDANVEIDILTITEDEKIYVGECKWKNHQINKKELNKLKQKCQMLNIEPTQIVLFSKSGFSKELIQLQSSKLALYSCEDFKSLVKSSSKENLNNNFLI